MRAREEAVSEIQEKMDGIAERIRGYYHDLGLAVSSDPEHMGIPVGSRLLESVISTGKMAEEAGNKLSSAEAFISGCNEKSARCESLRDQIGDKNKELKLARLRLGALIYEQCSLSILDKADFASVYKDADDEKQYSEKKSSDGFLDRLFSARGRARMQRSSDARLLKYAEDALESGLDGKLSGENAQSIASQCRSLSAAVKELSDELSSLSDELSAMEARRRALERSEMAKLKADCASINDRMREELISYGNYLFDRGASWIDQSTPAVILDLLDSILKSQNEYSELALSLDRIRKEAKADDYKAQIEEGRARILILQKEKERIDMQISQIQAEIDRLEGTVDRLSGR